ncbi:MAG: cytochrome c biogenesis protein CcsA [Actinomycetota bacterium]
MTGTATSGTGSSGTGTLFTRIIGAAALVVTAWVVVSAFFITPADAQQGDSVRIMYVHVPAAWIAYLAFITTAIASGISLARRHRTLGFDRVAGASAEVGVLFMGLALVTGSLWGRLTWGTFWQWDPRLTTTLFLFVTYVGYLAVRNIDGDPHRRARRSAVLALLAVLEIPLVHFSVVLWRSLHQEASVLNPDGDVRLDDLMLFTLFSGVVAFTLIFVWLVIHRQRLAALQDAQLGAGLDAAIAARRAETVATASNAIDPSVTNQLVRMKPMSSIATPPSPRDEPRLPRQARHRVAHLARPPGADDASPATRR